MHTDERAHLPQREMEYVSERSNLSQTESPLVCPYRMTVHLVRFAPMQLSKNRENAKEHQPRVLTPQSFSHAASLDGAILILATLKLP